MKLTDAEIEAILKRNHCPGSMLDIALATFERDSICSELLALRKVVEAAEHMAESLHHAWEELNAIRARDGAPQLISWDRGRPLQTDSCTHEWWDKLTDQCEAALTAYHTAKSLLEGATSEVRKVSEQETCALAAKDTTNAK